jgi:hypothetical protein
MANTDENHDCGIVRPREEGAFALRLVSPASIRPDGRGVAATRLVALGAVQVTCGSGRRKGSSKKPRRRVAHCCGELMTEGMKGAARRRPRGRAPKRPPQLALPAAGAVKSPSRISTCGAVATGRVERRHGEVSTMVEMVTGCQIGTVALWRRR